MPADEHPADTRPIALIWLRHDLRLADHPALALAIERKGGRFGHPEVWAFETPGAETSG